MSWGIAVANAFYSNMLYFEEQKRDELMREKLSPEAYKEYKHEKDVERRHKEMVDAIRSVKQEVTVKRYYW